MIHKSLALIAILAGLAAAATPEKTDPPRITEKHYRILLGNGESTTWEKMLSKLQAAEVVFLGEEHNDPVAHFLELAILKRLAEGSSDEQRLALSVEMFERDVQHVVDEYLADLITEKHFLASSRPWKNYQNDYRPLVEYAKQHGIPVVAANAPRRYVNLVSRQGPAALKKIPQPRLRGLPPLPHAPSSPAYAARFKKVMESHNKKGKKPPPGKKKNDNEKKTEEKQTKKKEPARTFDLKKALAAQTLWDAGMAYSIAEQLRRNRTQILHINGRFHSAKRLGIPEHLLRYRNETKFLVVTIISEKSFPKVKAKTIEGMGDFVIVTDRSLPRSYSSTPPKPAKNPSSKKDK